LTLLGRQQGLQALSSHSSRGPVRALRILLRASICIPPARLGVQLVPLRDFSATFRCGEERHKAGSSAHQSNASRVRRFAIRRPTWPSVEPRRSRGRPASGLSARRAASRTCAPSRSPDRSARPPQRASLVAPVTIDLRERRRLPSSRNAAARRRRREKTRMRTMTIRTATGRTRTGTSLRWTRRRGFDRTRVTDPQSARRAAAAATATTTARGR
jgi:hypothetical protein